MREAVPERRKKVRCCLGTQAIVVKGKTRHLPKRLLEKVSTKGARQKLGQKMKRNEKLYKLYTFNETSSRFGSESKSSKEYVPTGIQVVG